VKTSGYFDVHRYEIACKYNTPFRVVPVGDIHYDSPNFADARWQHFCETEMACKIPSFYFLMGDYIDFASSSERHIIRGGNLHYSSLTTQEKWCKSAIKKLVKDAPFLKGRTIAVLNGNHYLDFMDGTNSDQYLAGLLETKYLGVAGFVRLLIKRDATHSLKYDMFAHHGKTGASKASSIRAVNNLILSHQADCYLMGHNHDITAGKVDRLYLSDSRNVDTLKVKNRQIALVRTGSFLKTWQPGKVSYGVDRCYVPATIGISYLTIVPKRTSYMLGKRRLEELTIEVDITI